MRISASLLLAAAVTLWSAVACGSTQTHAPKTHSRARYVHKINLYDANDSLISPNDSSPGVYSPSQTCGKCHTYSSVSKGWHFNAGHGIAPQGRPAQAWILTDEQTGTQIPLSYRPWAGAYNPADVGLSPWDFIMTFGRHVPGGVTKEMAEEPDQDAKWDMSGELEIDCMLCHAAGGLYDPAERARQIEYQNFAWAPAVAAGLANVQGRVSQASDGPTEGEIDLSQFDPAAEDGGGDAKAPVKINYDKSRFDANDRAFLDITATPEPERCYFCHTNRPLSGPAAGHLSGDTDVHLEAGMTCTDCHRNELEHKITRGYEEYAEQRDRPEAAGLSCRGCHLGENIHGEKIGPPGRFGSPIPEHAGFPPVHFEKLSCTACHSGPRPVDHVRGMQTARANALGLSSQSRTAETPPYIVEPVFMEKDGVVGPYRVVHASYWARLRKEGLKPLNPEQAKPIIEEVLPVEEDKPRVINEEAVAKVLAHMAKDEDAAEPVYVSGGKIYRIGEGGELAGEKDSRAESYEWAIAHDVRPAGDALGNDCEDCHSLNAPFFYGNVTPRTPNDMPQPAAASMHQLANYDPLYWRAFAGLFIVRPLLKVVCFASAGVLGVVLLLYGLAALRTIAKAFASMITAGRTG